MCQRRSSAAIIVLALAAMLAVGLTTTSWGQLLKSSKTAPAPELRNVTQWINSEPLTMKKPPRQGRGGPFLDQRLLQLQE